MVSSADKAISVFKRWASDSARLRLVLGTDGARMTFRGKVFRITNSSIWCVGNEAGNELVFDLMGAETISFADAQGALGGSESSEPIVVDDLVAIVFKNGARLVLLNEPHP